MPSFSLGPAIHGRALPKQTVAFGEQGVDILAPKENPAMCGAFVDRGAEI